MSRFGRLFERFRPVRAVDQDDLARRREEGRWLIAGLGNPGDQYRRSRHNAGFMVARHLAAKNHVELSRRKFSGIYAEVRTDAGPAILLMPQTFYNRSGESVSAMLGYYKIPIDRLIVVHDEMDLKAGQLRVKRGGSDAGNRGVRSIIESLASTDFIRVRVGIGHREGAGDDINYLLRPLTDQEMKEMEAVFDRAADAVMAVMRDGLERAMNFYNQRA
jgi:peptidyl-tRNA hydrolase, PTH1 family